MSRVGETSNGLLWHLSDRSLFPIASSTPSQPTERRVNGASQQLSSMTSVAISAYDSASRLGLGLPQRMMVETNAQGPVLLHSYLNDPQSSQRLRLRGQAEDDGREILDAMRDDLRPLSGGTDDSSTGFLANGLGHDTVGDEETEESAVQRPPLLISTVLTSSTNMAEARRAAADVERFGRQFQQDWVTQAEVSKAEESSTVGEVG